MRDTLLLVLAQADTADSTPPPSDAEPLVPKDWDGVLATLNIVNDPQRLVEWLDQVPLIAGLTTVTLGVLCVLNGYRWHKWLVAILAFLAGLAIGTAVSQTMGKSVVVATAMGCLFALVARPLLKVSVAILGGLVGAFIGTSAWTAVETNAQTAANAAENHWAGAIVGFIVIAMLSMVLFRLVIVMFTSVGGAVMVVFGGLALLLQVPDWRGTVEQSLVNQPLTVPMLVLLAAVGGFIVQQSALQSSGVKVLGREDADES